MHSSSLTHRTRRPTVVASLVLLLALAGCENYDAANFDHLDPASALQHAAGAHDARGGGAAAALPDGRVLLVGGQSPFTSPVMPKTAELYDPAADAWHAVAEPLWYHTNPAAAAVADGRVLVVGSETSSTVPQHHLAEVYNPATNQWAGVPGADIQAVHPAALALPGTMRVLVSCNFGLVEFDLSTNSQRVIPGGWNGAFSSALARLPDGRVLAIFPENWSLFDPVADSVVARGALPRPHYEGAAVAGPDGRVYVGGGRAGEAPNTAPQRVYEIFDPIQRTFGDPLQIDGRLYSGTGYSSQGMFQAGGRLVYMSRESGSDLLDLERSQAIYGLPIPGGGASCQLPDGRVFTARGGQSVVTDLTKYPRP
ncbi:MAG: hypothetical protein H7330_17265 [Hymenobacteraceae bacterium]|nr:hypothetical protein [Hymenobacteraceae bacterium]